MQRLATALLLAAIAAAGAAQADFGVAEGFSGSRGITCTACHAPAVAPLETPAATVAVDGFPTQWEPGATYAVTVRVLGGPTANPLPGAPQGGFDLEASHGTFAAAAGMEPFVDVPKPNEALYSAEGSVRRDWSLTWTAPQVTGPPPTITLHAAGVAANGNHVVGLDTSGGEHGDATATWSAALPPGPAAVAAWQAMGLPVVALPLPAEVDGDLLPARFTLSIPAPYTSAEARIDDGPWQALDGLPDPIFVVPALAPGDHVLAVRTVAGDRSVEHVQHFNVEGGPVPPSEAASSGAWPIVGGVFLAVVLVALAITALAWLRQRN